MKEQENENEEITPFFPFTSTRAVRSVSQHVPPPKMRFSKRGRIEQSHVITRDTRASLGLDIGGEVGSR